MNHTLSILVAVTSGAALCAAFAACTDRHASVQAGASSASAPATEVRASGGMEDHGRLTDGWRGRWTGPEGTYLDIEGAQGRYRITIRDLDGPRTFAGRTAGDRITFTRHGETETIQATSGKETGMKWLMDKTDCLTIRTGEGYCRDVR